MYLTVRVLEAMKYGDMSKRERRLLCLVTQRILLKAHCDQSFAVPELMRMNFSKHDMNLRLQIATSNVVVRNL